MHVAIKNGICKFDWTRTTRKPAFWGYPSPPHDYPYYWVISDPKSKEDIVKVTNLKNLPKITNFRISKQAFHATNLQKMLNKTGKYEMDPTSIVEDTVGHDSVHRRTDPPTDRWTDRRTAKVKPVYPFNFVEARGIIKYLSHSSDHNVFLILPQILTLGYCVYLSTYTPNR